MKNKNFHLTILLFYLFFIHCYLAHSQTVKEYEWESDMETLFPDNIDSTDLILLLNKQIFEIDCEKVTPKKFSFFTNKILRKKFFINSEEGLEKFKNLTIEKPIDTDFNILEASIIKHNGSLIDLKSSDLKIEKLNSQNSFENHTYHYKLSIPGIEVGDIVDLYYSNKINGIYPGIDMYFHTDIPAVKTQFIFKINQGIDAEFYIFNSKIKPILKDDKNYNYYFWTIDSLESYPYELNYCKEYHLPFLRMILRDAYIAHYRHFNIISFNISALSSFQDWYENYFILNEAPDRENLKNLTNYFDTLFINMNDRSVTEKIKKFSSFIKEKVTIANKYHENSSIPEKEFLQNKIISERYLYSLYDLLFDYLEVEYKPIIVRDKFSRPYSESSSSLHLISDIIFLYYDNDTEMYLYPDKENMSFYLNELPYWIENTAGLLFKPHDKSVYAEIMYIKLPPIPGEFNYCNVNCIVYPDIKNRIFVTQYNERNSGHLATLKRIIKNKPDDQVLDIKLAKYEKIINKEKLNNCIVDYEEKEYPFKFNLSDTLILEKEFSWSADSIISFEVGDIISNLILEIEKKSTEFDYVVDFKYSSKINYLFKFPDSIKINIENHEENIINNVGSYSCLVNSISENEFVISSFYKIKTDTVKPHQINDLQEINDAFHTTMDKEMKILLK